MFEFKVVKKLHQARLSELVTPHGVIKGPFFQFVATQAAIRGMLFSEDLERMRVQIVLANNYHLHLRPGEDIVAEAGGLHGFMQWKGPITTDSGGYQVFSLGNAVKLTEEAVEFRSPLDGSLYTISPEKAIQIETKLGADIIMPLDICTPFGASYEAVLAAVEQTTRWAQRCKAEYEKHDPQKQVLYGIVQGSIYPDLRQKSAEELQKIGFFGYSIGGELRDNDEKQIEDGVRMSVKHLPENAPRYLMGSGTPEDIIGAVRLGVDQFDCVLPVRNARHGKLYFDLNKDEVRAVLENPDRPIDPKKLYRTIDITKASFARDFSVFSPNHPVIEKPYTTAYVHHLMRAEAPSGFRLAVLHNIYFYVQLMEEIRSVIH